MKTARAYFAILLACLLVFAQQASMAHALSHFAGEQSQQKHLPGTKACEKCAAFAELSGAIPAKISVFYLPHLGNTLIGDISSRCVSITLVPYQSRAPPVLL